jgi:hypothetical protein
MNDYLKDIEEQEKKEKFIKTFNDFIIYISSKIIFSFWFIYSLNTFFHTGFPYDFAHIISAWFFITIILQFITKKQ